MNMTNVLHRRQNGGAHETKVRRIEVSTPSGDGGRRGGWPNGAKVVVAVLLVAAVVSTIAAAVVAGGGGNDDEVRRLEERVAALTTERDDAVGDVADLDGQLATLRTELEAAQAAGDESAARVAELEGDVAAVTQERAQALVTVADLTEERDAALAAIAGLEGDVADLADEVATVRDQLAKAVAERNALAAAKSPKFDVSLAGVKVAGTYTAKVTNVYGTAPAFTKLTVSTTREGWLRVSIPGIADGGLSMADGVLHTVTGSTTAVSPCNGVARTAQVAITILPSGYAVGTDGSATPTGLNALVTVSAPATGSCPAVLSYATADLTRAG